MICPVVASVSEKLLEAGAVAMFTKLVGWLKAHVPNPSNALADVEAMIRMLSPGERAQLAKVLADIQLAETVIANVEKAAEPVLAAAAQAAAS